MIKEQLKNKKIAITGSTGFLGTALTERLLRSVPECQLILLVRPTRRLSAQQRVEKEILKNDCFDKLRKELGSKFDEITKSRITAIAGDVSVDGLGLDQKDAKILASCDIFIHSAASVSFDSPLDSAVNVNLLGPVRVAETLKSLSREHKKPLPHLIAVSTAYVGAGHHGLSPEVLVTESKHMCLPDWREEVAAAKRMRSDTDTLSRSVENLAKFAKMAREDLGAPGTSLLAERAEKHRQDFIEDTLVELGRKRAQALGWPDAYAYTKSLGEAALCESKGDLRVSFIRPSIVESSLESPHAGWIRGFRMAEPVIISYARNMLKQFPGVPEGVIDVIPVDLVTSAIITVAAVGPEKNDKPAVYQVSSSVRNPFRYGTLVNLCEDYFTKNPLYDNKGQPIAVPTWTFPGRGKVQAQLSQTVNILEFAEKILTKVPLRGEMAEFSADIEEKRSLAERALSYVELYGSYSETEARFPMDNSVKLYESLPDEDKKEFCFDPLTIDWPYYVTHVHLPSVVKHARAKTTPGKSVSLSREERARKIILNPEPKLAVFDLEQTIINSNVVESYAWLATRHLGTGPKTRLAMGLFAEGMELLKIDRRDRSDFLRYFYRRYEGAPAAQVKKDAWELFSDLFITRSYPKAIARIREHKKLGHKTVLITGALDFIVEPLRPLFDEIVAVSLGEENGKFNGEILTTPPIGEARAIIMEEMAAKLSLDKDHIVAYADSTSDLPMLEAAGIPVAVNPEPKLAAMARKRGWPIERWPRVPGGPKYLLAVSRRQLGASTILPTLDMKAE
ncbi:MAG: HAD-IB family phosphatase [Firmicutes bacterium]|nr:HAD-IB family phosphatase [Bacillota bacterium]